MDVDEPEVLYMGIFSPYTSLLGLLRYQRGGTYPSQIIPEWHWIPAYDKSITALSIPRVQFGFDEGFIGGIGRFYVIPVPNIYLADFKIDVGLWSVNSDYIIHVPASILPSTKFP